VPRRLCREREWWRGGVLDWADDWADDCAETRRVVGWWSVGVLDWADGSGGMASGRGNTGDGFLSLAKDDGA